MENLFLLIVFVILVFIAMLQDLKRKEVDDWLNFVIYFFGFSFIIFYSIIYLEFSYLVNFILISIFLFFIANFFYYGRIFGGGDCKLLIALSAFFVVSSFFDSIINVGIFILLLLLSGSVYGLFYIFYFYIRDFNSINLEISKDFRVEFFYVIILLFFLSLLSYFLYSYFWILYFSFLFFIAIILIISTKIERVSMVKTISGKELRLGDWLFEDIVVGKTKIKSDFKGLNEKDLVKLRKLRKVKIKDGIAFVPAFFLALILYIFRDFIIGFFI